MRQNRHPSDFTFTYIPATGFTCIQHSGNRLLWTKQMSLNPQWPSPRPKKKQARNIRKLKKFIQLLDLCFFFSEEMPQCYMKCRINEYLSQWFTNSPELEWKRQVYFSTAPLTPQGGCWSKREQDSHLRKYICNLKIMIFYLFVGDVGFVVLRIHAWGANLIWSDY